MRTLVIGDIHGGLRGLTQALNRAKVSISDKLIFLGDYVDGWSESAQTIQALINLTKKQKCTFMLGNHDIWCGLWLEEGKTNPTWLANGGSGAIESYIESGYITSEEHKLFFKNLKKYHLDSKNRLFLHAGFCSLEGVKEEEDQNIFSWDRTLWELAVSMKKKATKHPSFFPKKLKLYNEIYIGHTPTINYGNPEPMNALNVWNIDTGAAFTGKVSVLDIETKEFWQSDPLTQLYPEEKGRN